MRSLAALVFALLVVPSSFAVADADVDAPETSLSVSGPAEGRTVGGQFQLWISSATVILLNAYDAGTGVAATYHEIEGATSVPVGDGFHIVGDDGPHVMTFWSVDHAGNVEQPRTRTLYLDATAAEATITSPRAGMTSHANGLVLTDDEGTNVTLAAAPTRAPFPIFDESDGTPVVYGCFEVTAEASDAGIGLDRVEAFFDGESLGTRNHAPYEWYACTNAEDGEHVLEVVARDELWNAGSATLEVISKRELGMTCPHDDNGFALLGECHDGPLTPIFPDGCQTLASASFCKSESRATSTCDGATNLAAAAGDASLALAGSQESCWETVVLQGAIDGDDAKVTIDWCGPRVEAAGVDETAPCVYPVFFPIGLVPWGSLLP